MISLLNPQSYFSNQELYQHALFQMIHATIEC